MYAGYGITPPYIKTDDKCPGDQFKQTFNFLNKVDTTNDLNFYIEFYDKDPRLISPIIIDDSLMMKQWITPNEGKITIPAGETRYPILFTVNIPNNVGPGNYNGKIYLRSTDDNKLSSTIDVSIAIDSRRCQEKNEVKNTAAPQKDVQEYGS